MKPDNKEHHRLKQQLETELTSFWQMYPQGCREGWSWGNELRNIPELRVFSQKLTILDRYLSTLPSPHHQRLSSQKPYLDSQAELTWLAGTHILSASESQILQVPARIKWLQSVLHGGLKSHAAVLGWLSDPRDETCSTCLGETSAWRACRHKQQPKSRTGASLTHPDSHAL